MLKGDNMDRAKILLPTEHIYVQGTKRAKLPLPVFQGGHPSYAKWTPEQGNTHPLESPAFLLRYICGCTLVQASRAFPFASPFCALDTPCSGLKAHKGDSFQMNRELCSSCRPEKYANSERALRL